MKPALLKTVSDKWLQRLLADPAWCLQQKYDGVRAIVACRDGTVRATSRSGRELDLGPVLPQLPTDDGDWILDGELAWGCFYAFDDLTFPYKPYIERLTRATQRVVRWNQPRVRRVRTWREPAKKLAAFARARAQQVEGVVLKRLDAPHWSGVDQTRGVRCKFRRRCEVVGSKVGVDGKQNIAMGLYDSDREINFVGILPLGRATDWHAVGEAVQELDHEPVLEVEYLYATERNQLFQPRLVRVRYDKRPTVDDCHIEQLVGTHKGEMDGGPSLATFPAPPAVADPGERRINSADRNRAGGSKPPAADKCRSADPVCVDWVKVAAIIGGVLLGLVCAIGFVCALIRTLPTNNGGAMLQRVRSGGLRGAGGSEESPE